MPTLPTEAITQLEAFITKEGNDNTWSKMDDEIQKLAADFKLLPGTVDALRDAFSAMATPAQQVDLALESLLHKKISPTINTAKFKEAVAEIRHYLSTVGENISFSDLNYQISKMLRAHGIESALPVIKQPVEVVETRVQAQQAAVLKTQFDEAEQNQKNEKLAFQASEYSKALEKIKEQTASLAGAEFSPSAKNEAEVQKLIHDLQGLPGAAQLSETAINDLRNALTGLQNVKIGGEFEKLLHQIEDADLATKAFASGDPYAKQEVEAQKLGRELGITLPAQIQLLKQGLIQLAAIENIGKAWQGVDQLNAGGAKMLELQQQYANLSKAASTGTHKDDLTGITTQLSADQLAAVHLEMQRIAEDADKILLKTGSVKDGFDAWVHALQVVESEGEFVFNELTQATKGFESTAADSLVKILETHQGQHAKLIHELRSMWESYFAGLAKMAIQYGFQKMLQPVGASLEKAFHITPKVTQAQATANLIAALDRNTAAQLHSAGAGLGVGGATAAPPSFGNLPALDASRATPILPPLPPPVPLSAATSATPIIPPPLVSAAAAAPTAAAPPVTAAAAAPTAAIAPTVSSTLLGKLMPKAGGVDGASGLSAAGQTLAHAGTALVHAATELSSAAQSLQSSGGGTGISAGGGDIGDDLLPMHAEGGDATPGSSFISGEAGAEQVDLDRSGGAHITPLGWASKAGGDTYSPTYDLRGAVVTDDLLRKAEGAEMMNLAENRAYSRAVAATKEIGLRSRPNPR